MAAIDVGYGASTGKLLRNQVHHGPFGICLWGNSSVATYDISSSSKVGSNNSQASFYEYGGSIQATWASDNQGTFRKVVN